MNKKKPPYPWLNVFALTRLGLAVAVLATLGGCQTYSPHTQQQRPYVPSQGEYSYVSATKNDEQYVSAWVAAQGGKVEDEQVEDWDKAYKQAYEEVVDQPKAGVAPPKTSENIDDFFNIWGTPPGSVGQGVTILNSNVRTRFNDALATTPTGHEVKWSYGKLRFVFMPNSDIYTPHFSGGRCRDGILAHYVYGGDKNERVRGMFCQAGPGADWFLQR